MNDAKQSFEVWAAPRSLGSIERMRYGSVWEQAYEAGEIAMREKAAQRVEKNSCVRHCELCKTSPCGEQAAIMIRSLAISGAEESKKEKS